MLFGVWRLVFRVWCLVFGVFPLALYDCCSGLGFYGVGILFLM